MNRGGSSSKFGSGSSYGSGGGSRGGFGRGRGFSGSRSGGGGSFGGRSDSYGGGSKNGTSMAGGNLRAINWSRENLRPFEKCFYYEHATVVARNQFEIDTWLAENQVTLEGKDIPRPVFEFTEANYPSQITDLLYNNFQKPTTIQSISWPIAMSGRDIVSIAKTGSGKTLAVSCFSHVPVDFHISF
ncbi:unnamed protein product [Anisakis simplex]|uniref:DEAD domain-containing protein n=1 Tax=Anisakis simplex TaxID=6269 RepID=A0A0M3KAS1_ANISI|nr:unnamed protein product [Anisakis simplex]